MKGPGDWLESDDLIFSIAGVAAGLQMGDTYVEVPNADGHGRQAQAMDVDTPLKKSTDADGQLVFDRNSMVS